jgi:hypothetical protein
MANGMSSSGKPSANMIHLSQAQSYLWNARQRRRLPALENPDRIGFKRAQTRLRNG